MLVQRCCGRGAPVGEGEAGYHPVMVDDSDPMDMVIRGYDRLARRWDQWADEVDPPLRDRYVDWLEDRLDLGSSVLELGSGTGRPVAERLASRYRYLGLDVSTEMVTVARRNVRAGRFLVGDMRCVDLPVGQFDGVIAFYSIIHVPRSDHPALLRSIHGWLRPGGYLVACLSSEDLAAGVDEDWLGVGPMYWSGYDADTNLRMLVAAGFEEIHAEVVHQMEGEDEVRFLWCTARRPVSVPAMPG